LDVAEPRPVIIICGPTGSGKTSVAVDLARDFPIEVISADSRQIIKYLNIGTAKPSPEEQLAAPCHLIDMVEPGERYSAYQFIKDADRAIHGIISRRHIPLIVGGTGLYLKAFTDGVVETDESARDEIRADLEAEMDRVGASEMHRRLELIDPREAAKIHPNNKVRLIRALEIFELTGQSKSDLTASGAYNRSRYKAEYHRLMPEREDLYRVIERRVDRMIEDGLVDEVRKLVDDGKSDSIRRANVIGYNEILDFMEARIDLQTAVAAMKQNHRRYAKRQITWFSHQAGGPSYPDGRQMRGALVERLKVLGWVS